MIHVCRPQRVTREPWPNDWPKNVTLGYSKFRHRPVQRIGVFGDYYDPVFVCVAACGMENTRWFDCTERRKPCPRCFRITSEPEA